jgi:hypothetical protein
MPGTGTRNCHPFPQNDCITRTSSPNMQNVASIQSSTVKSGRNRLDEKVMFCPVHKLESQNPWFNFIHSGGSRDQAQPARMLIRVSQNQVTSCIRVPSSQARGFLNVGDVTAV